MGMKNTRMSRTYHPMPRQANPQRDMSGLRGAGQVHVTVNPDVGSGLAPKKSRPFKHYPYTDMPISAEEPTNGGMEGKKKQSKHERGAGKS